jgi:hypothetical protein
MTRAGLHTVKSWYSSVCEEDLRAFVHFLQVVVVVQLLHLVVGVGEDVKYAIASVQAGGNHRVGQ